MSYVCDMEDTRQRIVDCAIATFATHSSATLDTVADAASITRRTLNRYFSDKKDLLEACTREMLTTCEAAMTQAYQSSDHPVTQLERMLYAGIDCNYKFLFLTKLQVQTTPPSSPPLTQGYDTIKDKWFTLITQLQGQGLISPQLSIAWIFHLFGGMIHTTVHALDSGTVARQDLKTYAWYSFSRSVGLQD